MLLGRVFRRPNFDSGIKLFSGNTSLLETFSQIIGNGVSRDAAIKGEQPGAKPNATYYSRVMLSAEPAAEFNDAFGILPATDFHRFRVNESYRPSDLNKTSDVAMEQRMPVETELRAAKDVFRRHKCTALFTHKNTHLLSTMLSQTGKIMSRKQTGHSAKTQRQLSKVVRRARQMGTWRFLSYATTRIDHFAFRTATVYA